MSATNRAALFSKIHKVLKKHYDPVFPPSDRSVLEHLLYACVLENARHEQVDEVFAKLQKNYFDWNEVRVTSIPELAEVMAAIPDATEAAKRMKRALQSVFERHYQFDIEVLRKAGLGKAVESLQKFNGVTPFVIDYMTQNALGGHAIPINTAGMALLVVLDAVNAADAAKNRVPGLERAIAKNKGPEFASLLHQLGADFAANPLSTRFRSIVAEIDPSAKDRLPKKAPAPPPAPVPVRRAPPPGSMVPGERPPQGEKPGATKAGAESGAAIKGDKLERAEKTAKDERQVKGDKSAKDEATAREEKSGKDKPAKMEGKPAAKLEPKKGAKGTPTPAKPEAKVPPRSEAKPKSSATGLTRKKPK